MVDHRNTTTFEAVDISVPIERFRNGEPFNTQYVVRDADSKTVAQISGEIETAKRDQGEERGFMFSPAALNLFALLPRFLVLALFRTALLSHRRVKELSGTVFATSVSMFSSVPGFIVPYVGGPKSVSFAIGSTSRKPVVRGDTIEIRELISITVAFNHDAVDGAPAARCVNTFRRLVEKDYGKLL